MNPITIVSTPAVPDAPAGTSTQREVSRHLDDQFRTLRQQYAAARLGMKLFLTAEILLFAGLFCAYFLLRLQRPEVIAYGLRQMEFWPGLINLIMLASGSLTMMLAVRVAASRDSRYSVVLLLFTFSLGLDFIGVKTFEWAKQVHLHQVWGAKFYEKPSWLKGTPQLAKPAPVSSVTAANPTSVSTGGFKFPHTDLAGATVAPPGLTTIGSGDDSTWASPPIHHSLDPQRPAGADLFFAIYYATTGLFTIHLVGGMGALLWLTRRAARNEFGPRYSIPVELTSQYWHLLGLVWLVIVVLYYL